MNTATLIEKLPLTDEERGLLAGALSSRGRHAGYLTKNPPAAPRRKGVWLAIIGYLAPSRVQVWTLMFDQEVRDAHDEAEAILKRSLLAEGKVPVWALFNYTEPPYRWNMGNNGARRLDEDALDLFVLSLS